jgi:uncharacterized membrane protein YeaQ/YmgE (transglycosylase-associated protein family)
MQHLTLVSLVVLVAIAAVCGAIAQSLAGARRGGFLRSATLGFVGAVLGTWFAVDLGLPKSYTLAVGGESFPVVWAVVGAAVLLAAELLFTRHRSSRYTKRGLL